MQVTVFGANGKVGTLVVNELLERGIAVRAFIHGDFSVPKHPNLEVLQGDITDLQKIKQALVGSDVVISSLGSWGTSTKDILYVGMQNIIPAMEEQGIKRIITLTGADARDKNDPKGLVHRLSYPLLQVLAGKIIQDGEKHISLLRSSKLNWTTLRSPVMNETGKTGYTLSTKRPLPWATINRRAVAVALVDQIADTKHFTTSPFLKR